MSTGPSIVKKEKTIADVQRQIARLSRRHVRYLDERLDAFDEEVFCLAQNDINNMSNWLAQLDQAMAMLEARVKSCEERVALMRITASCSTPLASSGRT